MSQEKPGEVLAGSVGFLLSKLGAMSAGGFASALEPIGVQPQHFALLRILDMSSGISQQSLGGELSIPPNRMVGLIDEVEERGLVERRRSPEDRRVNALYLTAKGKRTLAKAQAIASDWEQRLCAGLSPSERDQLLALLQQLASGHELPIGVHPGLARPMP